MRPALLVAFLVALLGSACSSGGADGAAPAVPVGGSTWSGPWTSADSASPAGTLELIFAAQAADPSRPGADEVWGVADGGPCGSRGSLRATVAGDTITGTISAGDTAVALRLSVDGASGTEGRRGSGTYDVLAGPCAGETGALDLLETASAPATPVQLAGTSWGGEWQSSLEAARNGTFAVVVSAQAPDPARPDADVVTGVLIAPGVPGEDFSARVVGNTISTRITDPLGQLDLWLVVDGTSATGVYAARTGFTLVDQGTGTLTQSLPARASRARTLLRRDGEVVLRIDER